MKRVLALWISLWLLGGSACPAAENESFSEEAVKAAYLHRFASYVTWPPGSDSDSSFIIGVVGSEAVKAQLEQLLQTITLQGRPASVRAVARRADLEGVAILYVAPGRLATERALIAAASSRPILIVTDNAGGLGRGGIINFVRVERNVRFEVSRSAAERSGLKIDAALLGVAVRVETR